MHQSLLRLMMAALLIGPIFAFNVASGEIAAPDLSIYSPRELQVFQRQNQSQGIARFSGQVQAEVAAPPAV